MSNEKAPASKATFALRESARASAISPALYSLKESLQSERSQKCPNSTNLEEVLTAANKLADTI
jgi:hypothetical protein